jgi:hypothetical protein
MLSGCDGCRLAEGVDEEAKKLEQQKPPFTSIAAKAYPATRPDSGNSGFPDGSVKPGHWTSAGFSLRSNREDRRGVVQTQATVGRSETTFIDGPGLEIPEPEAATSFVVRRPAVLPKGQLRKLDTRFLVPSRGSQTVDNILFNGDFLAQDSTGRLSLRPSRFATLLPQTYFFVILTDRPERFTHLQIADWVTPHQSDTSYYQPRDNFRIVIPPTEGVLPIAETVLDWSATAVLFWDDVPTTALTPTQRTAILDWLHFGGLIIVNGPAGVDSLSDANFRELLPIQANGVEELRPDDATQFVRSHTIDTDLSVATVNARLADEKAQVAIAGTRRPDTIELGEGGLVVERRVGRGRIVQSRVDLLSDWLVVWQSYDSFFNSAVLARPPRVHRVDRSNGIAESISIGSFGVDEEPSEKPVSVEIPTRQTFVDVEFDIVPPSINTGVRFFSRDSKMPAIQTASTPSVLPAGESPSDESPSDATETLAPVATSVNSPLAPWLSDDVWPDAVSGLGGWKNDSPVMAWSRDQLRREIGVTIPDSKLVFRSLLIYLVVLIPVNYLVFRVLGRLEWAWLAVVPLSILGAFWVARAAQLDVGFARSRNELAMLELPADYSRGHLTRVVGLYNSLASQYRIDFPTPDAAIDLIRTRRQDEREASLFGKVEPELEFGVEAGPSFDNIGVGSNSYGVVHVEQIVDVDGSIRVQTNAPEKVSSGAADAVQSLDGATVTNGTSLDMLDAFVVDCDAEGRVRVATLGTMASGSRKPIRFQASGSVVVPSNLPMGMTDWMSRLLSPATLLPNSSRLVARLEQPLSGVTITPDCKQVRAQTLILAHLRYPPRPNMLRDKNLASDFKPEDRQIKPPVNPASPTLKPNTR